MSPEAKEPFILQEVRTILDDNLKVPTKAELLRDNLILRGSVIGTALGYATGVYLGVSGEQAGRSIESFINALYISLWTTGVLGAASGAILGGALGYIAYKTYTLFRPSYFRS